MLKSSLLFVFVFCALLVKSQDSSKVILSGSIKDAETGEGLIGATVIAKSGIGAVADLEGNFILKLPKGEYTIEVSMLGYNKYIQKMKLYSNKKIEVKLENAVLDEVEVVADMAKIRETPVAFSSISGTKIQEELGGKDISMIANTTPGAYATSQGGGAGDSRVTIRGFDQRNIGVLVDGIPVNDMENGQVFWSNWDGLKDITKSMQIQRGLGASKLAISSVGGTMNFITNGIDSKQQTIVKKEWGNNNANVMSLAHNTGLINNKWGFTLAGTYRSGDGWVTGTDYNAFSYFVKVQFMPNPRHIISIGANGAPQSHGQKNSKMPISVYDKDYAQKLGVDQTGGYWNQIKGAGYTSDELGDRNLNWNPDLIILDKKTIINERTNVFHKPLFNLNHFWKISEKTTLSTVVYASIGRGGGSNFNQSVTTRDLATGYYTRTTPNINNSPYSAYPGERSQNTIIRMQNNSHNWYGILSTATTKLNKIFTLTYGIDLRYYKGIHTNTVYNLLGGDYYMESPRDPNLNPTNLKNFAKRKNDIYGVNYNGFVKWGGVFGQVEFKKNKWTAFFTGSGSTSGYNRVDYYKKKDIVINGNVYQQAVKYGEQLFYNGNDTITATSNATVTTNGDTTFVKNSAWPVRSIVGATSYDINSSQARASESGWQWQLGYTLKGGANYNINDHHSVFVNIGIMQIPQKLANVFTSNNAVIKDFRPQKVKSVELGYGLKYNKLSTNFNAYYTLWDNQPQTPFVNPVDGNTYNLNGINAIYKGIELDLNYNLIKQISIEGVASIGDWRYSSGGTIYVTDVNGNTTGALTYDAKNVHIGNAAQTQYGFAIRFMPIKGFYFKPRFTEFQNNYSQFNAADLRVLTDNSGKVLSDNRGKESWKMPNYHFVDLSTGYEFAFSAFRVSLYGTMGNVFNTRYISDAQNNGFSSNNSNGFDATSATVFFAVGRTYTFGTKLTF